MLSLNKFLLHPVTAVSSSPPQWQTMATEKPSLYKCQLRQIIFLLTYKRHLHITDINIGHGHTSSVGNDEVGLNQTVVTGDSPKGIVDGHVSDPVGGNGNGSCLAVGHGTGALVSGDGSRGTRVGVERSGNGVTVAVDDNDGQVLRWVGVVKSSSNGVDCHSTINGESVGHRGGCRSSVWQGKAGSSQSQQRNG